MVKRARKHKKSIFFPIKKITLKESLYPKKGNIPLSLAQTDRISFSILRNDKNEVRKIENISYEININGVWEWVVRYDDHGGSGFLHRHVRISLKDKRAVESVDRIKKYKNKSFELTWACKEIQRDHLIFRKKFCKNSGLDLY